MLPAIIVRRNKNMANKKHWWQEVPLTISAVQANWGNDPEWVLDEYVAKQGFNTEQLLHLTAEGILGNYNEKRDAKRLDRYLQKSRAHGIREIVYFNTHIVDGDTAKEHPEWCERTSDGKAMIQYGTYNLVCVNPEGSWHKQFLKDIEALCKHDIDGIFLDGPAMRETGCYCDACRATFEKRFGHSIYEATRRELYELRIGSVTQHIKEAYELVKSINPEIALYFNNHPIGGSVVGVHARKLYDYVDIIGNEGGFHRAELNRAGLWKVSSNMKALAAISEDMLKGEKPLVCFFAGNMSGTPCYMHTPAETQLIYSQALANGANVWYGVHFSPSEFMNTEACLTAKEMNEFVLSNKSIFAPSKTCARVAIVWSRDTTDNYETSIDESDFVAARKADNAERGDLFTAVTFMIDVLERNHIQFDIMDEHSIQDGTINRYEAVILPELACVSEKTAECIRRYVAEGGNVLANFDVGVYDEFGEFEGKSKLGDVFGISGELKTVKLPLFGTSYTFKEKEDALLDALSFFRIPSPMLNAEWDIAPDAEVLMSTGYPYETVFGNMAKAKRFPSVIKHTYGKGCAYYISGTIGETATNVRNIPDYTNLVRQFCDITSRPVVKSDAPGLYEVVLRRQENRFILHVVNLTGAMERPVRELVPLYNVPFELNLDGFGIEKEKYSVDSVRGANLKNVRVNGNKVSFELDKLDAYEIIVIE